jgi:YVTN family beta-propeller protein
MSLKGLDEPVAFVRVVPEGVDSVERLSPYAPIRAPEPRHRPRWPALAAAALAVVLFAVGLPHILDGGVVPTGNSMARIDPGSGKIGLATTLGTRPGAVTAGFGSIWVAEPDRGSVSRLDVDDGTVIDKIQVGSSPTGIAAGEGSVWVTNAADGTVSRISPATNQQTQLLDVGSGPAGIAIGDGALWIADSVADQLVHVALADGDLRTVPLPSRPTDVRFTPSGVWVSSSAASAVTRVDPASLDITLQVTVGNGPTAVLPAFGSIWVANHLDGTVSRIDPSTGQVRATVSVGDGPNAIAEAEGLLWVANQFASSVVAIDPSSEPLGVEEPLDVGGSVGSLASTPGGLWVAVGSSDSTHRGGTLRIDLPEPIETLDPAIAYGSAAWEILSITNDGLVAFQKTGGAEGGTVVPDLASALPAVSNDGLTVRFALRQGLRYATGQVIEPEDFRYGLERAFSLSADAVGLFPAIRGAAACNHDPSTCDLSQDIEVTQDSVTFRLGFADADLAYRLALPFAFPVPVGTPIEDRLFDPVPATGPYMIRSADETHILLERNDAFREWSAAAQPDGFVDRLEWTFGTKPSEAFDSLLAGETDWLAGFLIPPDQVEELRAAHPEQLVEMPAAQTVYMGFNLRKPPFDDVRVRQAVNFAIDRERVQEIFGGPSRMRVTCQILPANFPGYEPYCPYTKDPDLAWSAPDIGRARALVRAAGAVGSKVSVWAPDVPFLPGAVDASRYLVGVLNDLGLRPKLHVETDFFGAYVGAVYAMNRFGVDVYQLAWQADYPGPGGFIDVQFRCGIAGNSVGFCDRRFDRRVAAAQRLALTDPAAANARWADLDRELVDQAVWVPLANPIQGYAFSSRVGNAQVHPQWGVLLSRLWVR